jgi:hypothetical protein
MGYYNYQNGLIFHHISQEGGWANHQEHCRNFILKALDLIKPEKVTVLGSGWLLDLPFAEIIERTSKVYLIDIIHPPDVISQVQNYPNVELIEQDITGGLISEVWQKTRKYSFMRRFKSLESIEIPEYKADYEPGMVISLNILTQLESLLVDFLKKRSRLRDIDFSPFKSEVQRKHLDFLNKHKSVIVTDYAEVITSRKGVIKTIPTLLTDLPKGNVQDEWTWNFDKPGGDLYNCKSQFKVIAMIN